MRTNAQHVRTHNFFWVDMQETPSQQLQSHVLSFSEFLTSLMKALDREGVRPCVLRNYESFPANNAGSDVDFLIYSTELQRALLAVRSIQGIRIVSYELRSYVASVFLEGIASLDGSRSLQLDFLWSLSWKNMPYLCADDVLQLAMPYSAGTLRFFVPLPVHEAIISLLTGLIYGGWAKEKYLAKARRTFADNTPEVIAALQQQFGLKAATRFVDVVIGGDRQEIHGRVRSIRASLTIRSLLYSPLRTLQGICRYYSREIVIRFSSKYLTTVCIVGTDSYDKTTMIEELALQVASSAKVVEKHHFSLDQSLARESSEVCDSTDIHAQTSCSPFASMTKLTRWLLGEWLGQFTGRKNCTLRLFDKYYHSLLVSPGKYCYRGPFWFARLVGGLTPSPDLWILLDQGAEGLQSRQNKVLTEQTLKQLEAYRSFVKARKRYVIVDASQPAESIREMAYSAVIDMLERRTARLFKSRL